MLFVVGRNNGGGISLLWKKKNISKLIGFSTTFVDVEIQEVGSLPWRLIGFYGHPERLKRKESWSFLKHLNTRSVLPWVCLGDFNELFSQSEKKWGSPHPFSLIWNFKEAVEVCGFKEIGMVGYPFTWEKSRGTA